MKNKTENLEFGMGELFTSTGILKDGCKLTLDRNLPIISGKVQVTVEPIEISKDLSGSQWQSFVNKTYGCLAQDPIDRGDQSHFEIRDAIE